MMSKNKRGLNLFGQKRRLFVLVCAMLLLVVGGFAAYAFGYSKKILPRTVIAGVKVGGMSKEEALAAIEAKEKQFLEKPLILAYEEKKWNLAPKDFAVQFQNADTVDQAYSFGKTGGFSQELADMALALIMPRYLEVDLLSISEAGKAKLSEAALKDIETPTAETALQYVPGRVSIIPGKNGKMLDYNLFETDLYRDFKTGSSDLTLKIIDFAPKVTPDQAESERIFAERLLAEDWKIKASGSALESDYILDQKTLASWLSSTVNLAGSGQAMGLTTAINEKSLQKFVEDYAYKANKKPANVQLGFEGGVPGVIKEATEGLTIKVDQTIAALKERLLNNREEINYEITAASEKVSADLRRDNLSELGIKELIGRATTDFSGSPNNRKLNIALGQRSLNGGLVKNGEVYSTTTALGPVDESTGYLPELVIINNRTVPEAGGGLCQVSTTLFRAVLNAGLPVIERTNHAYRVGYYEREVGPGLDATVYIPQPDFKWENDTGHAVYIYSYVKENKITFELYGTKDGRTSSISKPQILEETPPGEPIKVETDTLFEGETRQIETPHSGAKTLVTYVVARDGKEINRQNFRSTYRPWPAQFLIGTKKRE